MSTERKLMKKIRKDIRKELTTEVISDLDKSWTLIVTDLRRRHSLMRKLFISTVSVLILETIFIIWKVL